MSPSSLSLHSHSVFTPRTGFTVHRRPLFPSQSLVFCSAKPAVSAASNLSVSDRSTIDATARIGSLSQVSGVLGCQWGDEGKGKLVDILAHHFDIVARCQV